MTAYWLAYMYIVFLALIESPSHPLKDSIEKRNFNLQKQYGLGLSRHDLHPANHHSYAASA